MSILLRGGTLLLHDSKEHIIPTKSDLLIIGNTITEISPHISPPKGTEVIDCTDKIVSPGFIDTHRHLWQTPLKGRHANELLLGNMAASLFSPQDIYWGTLSGCLESLDSGTTTVIDHAHMNYSPAHNSLALAGVVDSGMRCVWCYCAHNRVESWDPLRFEEDVIPSWYWEQLRGLVEKEWGRGRVQVGVGWDTWYFPEEDVKNWFGKFREMGVKLITSHSLRSPTLSFSAVEPLVNYGLIAKDILLSHATGVTPLEISQILASGAHISSTPSTELQMALGEPKCLHPELSSISSLGVDCHSAAAADIVGQMRLILQYARGTRNQKLLDGGRTPKTVGYSVEEVFNLGTINGARAIGMGDELGKLEVGRRADIVIWDGLSPGMLCAAEQDPVAAIVLHSSPRDVDTVIVDGLIRKQDGKLKPIEVTVGEESAGEEVSGKRERVEWKDVARKVVGVREKIEEKVKAIDYAKVRLQMFKAFYVDEGTLSDTLPSDVEK